MRMMNCVLSDHRRTWSISSLIAKLKFLRKTLLRKREPEHLRTGRWGEDQAAHLLRRKGYRILGRRVVLHHREELDLVARQADLLVFVEVKTRRSDAGSRPADAVNLAKQRQLTRAAARYVGRLRSRPPHVRFDIIEVVGKPGDRHPRIHHIEGAFTASNFRFDLRPPIS